MTKLLGGRTATSRNRAPHSRSSITINLSVSVHVLSALVHAFGALAHALSRLVHILSLLVDAFSASKWLKISASPVR